MRGAEGVARCRAAILFRRGLSSKVVHAARASSDAAPALASVCQESKFRTSGQWAASTEADVTGPVIQKEGVSGTFGRSFSESHAWCAQSAPPPPPPPPASPPAHPPTHTHSHTHTHIPPGERSGKSGLRLHL